MKETNENLKEHNQNQMNHEHMNHEQLDLEQMDHEHMDHEVSGSKDGGHHDHHEMMVADFRKRFFASLFLMIPILLLTPMIQSFLGVNLSFPGDKYLLFGLSTVLFFMAVGLF
jgi:hypothetical protein